MLQYLIRDDSEIFTITIVERVVITVMNVITTVDLLNISIHNNKIKHEFLNFYELSVLGSNLYHFTNFLLVNLHIFHTNSLQITIQVVRQSTITIVNRPRLSRWLVLHDNRSALIRMPFLKFFVLTEMSNGCNRSVMLGGIRLT